MLVANGNAEFRFLCTFIIIASVGAENVDGCAAPIVWEISCECDWLPQLLQHKLIFNSWVVFDSIKWHTRLTPEAPRRVVPATCSSGSGRASGSFCSSCQGPSALRLRKVSVRFPEHSLIHSDVIKIALIQFACGMCKMNHHSDLANLSNLFLLACW